MTIMDLRSPNVLDRSKRATEPHRLRTGQTVAPKLDLIDGAAGPRRDGRSLSLAEHLRERTVEEVVLPTMHPEQAAVAPPR